MNDKKHKLSGYLLQCFKTWVKRIRYRTSLSFVFWLAAFVPSVDLLTSPHKFNIIWSLYFTLFTWSHFCAFLCRFNSIYYVIIHCHLSAFFILHFYVSFCGMLSPISYNVVVSFAFLVFARHTAHCFLFWEVARDMSVVKRVKWWVAPRRSKTELYIFNVATACLPVCSVYRYLRKEKISYFEIELNNLLSKVTHTISIF